MPFLHSDALSVIAGELALSTSSELEEGCVGLSVVAVLVVTSHRPLVFPKCVAVHRCIGSGRGVPDIVTQCPFSISGPIESNLRGHPSLEPDISETVRPLDGSKLKAKVWVHGSQS